MTNTFNCFGYSPDAKTTVENNYYYIYHEKILRNYPGIILERVDLITDLWAEFEITEGAGDLYGVAAASTASAWSGSNKTSGIKTEGDNQRQRVTISSKIGEASRDSAQRQIIYVRLSGGNRGTAPAGLLFGNNPE